MVKIHVKKGEESQFLYETSVVESVEDVTIAIVNIYNGRLKISRLCGELEELINHGTMFPPNIMGLTDEQVEELKLVDEWGEKCIPSGGWTLNKDPIGRRNGRQPSKQMQNVIAKTINEAKTLISKKQIDAGICVTQKMVQEALDMLRGAVRIVYPMNLPPHDVIRLEFENNEDLTGTQASLDVIDPAMAVLWFSGKEMQRGEKLSHYLGKNEKTKVIIKISKVGQGPPAREPVIGEEERKQMMLHQFRRQEELKRLEEDDDDKYLNSSWADSNSLKKSFQGLSNISWKPK